MNGPSTCQQQQGACQLSYKTVGETQRRALDILHRFYTQGDISWEEQETMYANVEHFVWLTYNKLREMAVSQNLLTYYRDSVYEQLRQLLRRKHRLELSQDDENAFKYVDLDELTEQMRI